MIPLQRGYRQRPWSYWVSVREVMVLLLLLRQFLHHKQTGSAEGDLVGGTEWIRTCQAVWEEFLSHRSWVRSELAAFMMQAGFRSPCQVMSPAPPLQPPPQSRKPYATATSCMSHCPSAPPAWGQAQGGCWRQTHRRSPRACGELKEWGIHFLLLISKFPSKFSKRKGRVSNTCKGKTL